MTTCKNELLVGIGGYEQINFFRLTFSLKRKGKNSFIELFLSFKNNAIFARETRLDIGKDNWLTVIHHYP